MLEDFPKRMTDNELKEFVMGYCDGRIFTNLDLDLTDRQSSMLASVFMPLVFMRLTPEKIKDVGLVWEFLHHHTRTAINGNPTFVSCRFMHKDDWKVAKKAIAKELKRRKGVKILYGNKPRIKAVPKKMGRKQKVGR